MSDAWKQVVLPHWISNIQNTSTIVYGIRCSVTNSREWMRHIECVYLELLHLLSCCCMVLTTFLSPLPSSPRLSIRNKIEILEIWLNLKNHAKYLSLELIIQIFEFTSNVMPKITFYLILYKTFVLGRKKRNAKQEKWKRFSALFSLIWGYPESFFTKIPAIDVKKIEYYPQQQTVHNLRSFRWLFILTHSVTKTCFGNKLVFVFKFREYVLHSHCVDRSSFANLKQCAFFFFQFNSIQLQFDWVFIRISFWFGIRQWFTLQITM